jgi:hypothetical protein
MQIDGVITTDLLYWSILQEWNISLRSDAGKGKTFETAGNVTNRSHLQALRLLKVFVEHVEQ